MTRFTSLLAVLALLVMPASAQTAFFSDPTDVIQVDGQTVLGGAATYEAVVLFPNGGAAWGRVFNEWTGFLEDKVLIIGPTQIDTYNWQHANVLTAPVAMAPDVWHHVAFVFDGSEERIYVDGRLVASQGASGGVGNGGGLPHIGAIFRDNAIQNSFIGYLESLRVSRVARYTGEAFEPPTGDLPSDDDTQLLLNFDEDTGSTTVQDESPQGLTGTLGTGFDGATAPELGPGPPSSACPRNPVAWDLWNVSRGVTVTASSGFLSGNEAEGENFFGGDFSTPEPGTGFFRDDRADGYAHYVEWETAEPVTIQSFYLLALHGLNDLRRAFSTFRLLGYDESASAFELLYEVNPPIPYGEGQFGNVFQVCEDVPEMTTSRFRAEFVQLGTCTFCGPRVLELDAFTTPRGVVGGTPTEAAPASGSAVLHAPMPNPATGRAVLVYDLTEAGPVRLGVYDALGREVTVLVDGVRPAGRHEAVLDGAALPSGVYLVRLTAGPEAITRRLTLLR